MHGCREEALQTAGFTDIFRPIKARENSEALALLPEVDRQAQKPGLMMANIYRSLLREIEAAGFQVLHQRTSLTPLRKLWIALLTHWRGR